MKVVDTTQIYSFAPIAAQNDFAVSPSEHLITLTYGQLQELITQAVERTIQPLQDEITALREERDQDWAEFERFKAAHRAFAVQTTKDLDALFEANLKATSRPQPLQKDRADILRALLAANNGKMLAKDARNKMHLKKNQFSELLAICDFIEMKPYHLDGRKKLIILKSELVQ